MNYMEFNKVVQRIDRWYEKRTKVLSIKTRPFNTLNIFFNLILRAVNNNEKVLYVWCNQEEIFIKQKEEEIYEIINYKDKKQLYKQLRFITLDRITEIKGRYDIVIFDDISLFSKVSNIRIREAIEEVYWICSKILVYSYEIVFPIGEKIEVPYLVSKKPIIEPRYLSTRIKIEEDIPLALFDYFKWFNENNKRVLLIVPSEEKLNKVFNRYYSILKQFNIRVVRYTKNQNYSYIEDLLRGYNKSIFIVTNSIGEYINKIPDVNVVMLFSDDLYYNYKKITYISSAVNKSFNDIQEIIMVSRETTENMDKAKSIIRKFNKSLWEKQR